MKKLFIVLILLSLLKWCGRVLPACYFPVGNFPFKFVYKPNDHTIQTLDNRYLGGNMAFFKRIELLLLQYKESDQQVHVSFEVDCSGNIHLLNIRNAPTEHFQEDIYNFLASSKFRWLACQRPYYDQIEFDFMLSGKPSLE